MASSARFDDLRTRRGLAFDAPDRVLSTADPGEIRFLVEELEQAVEAGAWAYGFLAYESAPGLDPALPTQEGRVFDLPLLWFGVGGPPRAVPVLSPTDAPGAEHDQETVWQPNWTPDAYAARVAQVRQRIAAGDTYQINLTERLTTTLTEDPYDLYRRLALAQGGAYNAYLDLGAWVIASASPELFLEQQGDRITMRPMKGTVRRGRFAAEDAELAAALQASAKDRAENLMIVDLIRNDLARISRTGTVETRALFAVERYETVWQLTSEVTAQLTPEVSLADRLAAVFPCGSVTGAPKSSSMGIIAELESSPRGPYCGVIGYLAPPTEPVRARFSVAIRTAVIETGTGRAVYGAGGGIVWDSEPDREHAELLAKTAVLHQRTEDFELWETMRFVYGGGVRNLDRHLGRLADSAAHLGFRYDEERVRAAVMNSIERRSSDARLRIRLSRRGATVVDVQDAPVGPDHPIRLVLDDEPVDASESRWFHKTSRREPYERRRARHPKADDVIMINTHGRLTETTIANLALHLDGRWWTPPLDDGLLPGVERGRLIDAGALTERSLTVDDLGRAESVAVLNSLRGWRSAEWMRNQPGLG